MSDIRQVVLDTETTGLSPKDGHKIIEIGCVELINRRLTGRVYHQYINPNREIEAGAMQVHGITNEFVADKPLFEDIAEEFKAFIEGAELIIHNAPFDVGFIEHEFKVTKNKWRKLSKHCKILDTLALAREKHPGQKNNLDALCKRYEINNQHRTVHGALLDSEILAEVYLVMTGGQKSLSLDSVKETAENTETEENKIDIVDLPIIKATQEELAKHQKIVANIQKKYGLSLWSVD